MSRDLKKHTLCWGCARSGGLCAWSRSFKPVPGWKAEPTIINNAAETGHGRHTPSYHVIECPEYVPG